MTQARVNRWIGVAVVTSALLAGFSSPSHAGDVLDPFGGLAGQVIGQSVQQPYYQSRPQNYQRSQQPQQPPYDHQQPQYNQREIAAVA